MEDCRYILNKNCYTVNLLIFFTQNFHFVALICDQMQVSAFMPLYLGHIGKHRNVLIFITICNNLLVLLLIVIVNPDFF